jgi:hypothetical protein
MRIVSSDDRDPVDHAHVALCFFGLLIGAAGMIILHAWLATIGVLMLMLGLIYFSMQG